MCTNFVDNEIDLNHMILFVIQFIHTYKINVHAIMHESNFNPVEKGYEEKVT